MAQKPKETFEGGLAELEDVVRRLENGDLSLEDALGAFERGVGLVRRLQTQLTEAEQRVDTLTRDAAGDPPDPPAGGEGGE